MAGQTQPPLTTPQTFTQPQDNRGNPFIAAPLSALLVASQDVVTGAASAQSTAFAVTTKIIRVSCTVACRILTGANPVALANSTLLPPNWIDYLWVNPGDKLAAIQEGAGGKLSITELP